MESKSVSDANLTSEGVGWCSMICDDAVGLQVAGTEYVESPILKWKFTQLGM